MANNKYRLLVEKLTVFILAVSAMPVMAQNIIPLSTFQSTAGESKDAFILRIAPVIDEWTAQNHAEACGAITVKDGLYAVVITTQGSQVQCDSIMVMKGWTAIGETVHSHSMPENKDGILYITHATSVVSEGHLHQGERIRPVYGFSGGDYVTGPGYVILGRNVLYQNGPGTSVSIN